MKVFYTRNHAERKLQTMAEPWTYEVPRDVKAMTKDSFADFLNSRYTNHRTLTFCLGDNEGSKVTSGNQCRQIHGFFADYDGAFSPELIESAKAEMTKAQIPAPSWWVLTHSNHLRLVWEFEAPVGVMNNAAAASFLSAFARKVEASKWGARYDIASEKPTQLFDIGNEWHEFCKDSVVSKDLLDAWAFETVSKNWKFESKGKVIVPFDEAIRMLREIYPEQGRLPPSINQGTRWNRFWDPDSDNMTGIMFFEGGVYNFITGKDMPVITWDDERLLGKRRCEKYQAELTSPIVRKCAYDANTNKYWREKADTNAGGSTHSPRTKGDFMDDLENLGINPAKPKGGGLSEMDKVLFRIREERLVDAVVPVLYRDPGIVKLPDTNKRVLNISNVRVLPVPKNAVTGRTETFSASVTDDERKMFPWADQRFVEKPDLCEWNNPFVTRHFPHVHRFITTLFLPNETARKDWERKGYEVPNLESPDPMTRTDDMSVAYHQIVMLLSWLSVFYRQGESRRVCTNPGQAIVIAGPASAGKTFLAKKIIGRLAGGFSSAKSYFLDNNHFTNDIVCSPFVVIDDAMSDLKGNDRDRMTNLIKQTVATGQFRVEAKFQSPLESLPWSGRIGIFCNSDAQSLSVLPSLEASTKDKFMMLKAGNARYPFSRDFAVQEAWIMDELPWFAAFLMGYHIPERFTDVRYGVHAWQHPSMVKASQVTGFTHTLGQILVKVLAHVPSPDDAVRDDRIAFEGKLVDLWTLVKSDASGIGSAVKDTARLYYGLKGLAQHYSGVVYDEDTDLWTIERDFMDGKACDE